MIDHSSGSLVNHSWLPVKRRAPIIRHGQNKLGNGLFCCKVHLIIQRNSSSKKKNREEGNKLNKDKSWQCLDAVFNEAKIITGALQSNGKLKD